MITPVETRVAPARALQLVVGRTTKREILELVPDANVGVPSQHPRDEQAELDSTDLRWVYVGGKDVGNLEWIVVYDHTGTIEVVTDEELEARFRRLG